MWIRGGKEKMKKIPRSIYLFKGTKRYDPLFSCSISKIKYSPLLHKVTTPSTHLKSCTVATQHLWVGILTEILSDSLKLLESKICSQHSAVAGVPGSPAGAQPFISTIWLPKNGGLGENSRFGTIKMESLAFMLLSEDHKKPYKH